MRTATNEGMAKGYAVNEVGKETSQGMMGCGSPKTRIMGEKTGSSGEEVKHGRVDAARATREKGVEVVAKIALVYILPSASHSPPEKSLHFGITVCPNRRHHADMLLRKKYK